MRTTQLSGLGLTTMAAAGAMMMFMNVAPASAFGSDETETTATATVTVSTGDALDEALGLVGLTRADLGWRPKGYWTGFPADIPYKLRQFDDLFAEPLANVSYLRTMANSARTYLAPERLDAPPARASAGALYQAVHGLGVVRKTGSFRAYSCNLTAVDTPLAEAILSVYDYAGRQTEFVTFGAVSPYPMIKENLAKAIEVVPEAVQPIVGKLVLNVLDAHHWATLAMRNVPLEDRVVVSQRLNIGAEEVDALEYCPEFDDVEGAWDEASMWYAGLKCVEALDQARLALKDIEDVGPFVFNWETPIGWIRIHGSGDNLIEGTNTLISVDLGGGDWYTGPIAGSNALHPISLSIDMKGDDLYESDRIAQGGGVCGIGVLLDVEGDDRYEANQYAQGAGQFGLGACIDLAGNDRYFNKHSGQGCGYFGVGVLIDVKGEDEYTLYSEGQGFGGVAGVGTLVDCEGNDQYEAVVDATITGRGSYHSGLVVSVSNAQGCAMGRRGDGADGHSWAGGMGSIIDLEGNDVYTSGNWSQGTGYWFGMGFLYDGTGDDVYNGVAWSQATGAHFCIGVLIDEGGNDQHLSRESSHNSLAFAHDFSIALLINLGGDDVYELEQHGLSHSINRSVSMLIDIGGDDIYRESPQSRPGMTRYDAARLDNWDGSSTYFADSTSVGLFLDIGGTDVYDQCIVSPERRTFYPMPGEVPAPVDPNDPEAIKGTILACQNNSIWLDPKDHENWAVRNLSVGVDREEGTVDFRPIPEKPVSSPQN